MINTILGSKYKLKNEIGAGGTAKVYLATQLGKQGYFAIKIINTKDDKGHRLLEREIDTLKKLQHGNIVRFIDSGFDEECGVYMVLEHIDGVEIKNFVENKPLPLKLDLFMQILDGLGHAHARNIIHRDIKPSNIFVTTEEQPIIKILDFGIAGLADTISPQHTIRGYASNLFSPPEQVKWEGIERGTDIYAVAMLFLYLLADKSAQDKCFHERDKKVLYDAVRISMGDDEKSRNFVDILKKATHDDLKERPKLEELRLQLSELQEEIKEKQPVAFFLTKTLRETIDLENRFDGFGLKINNYFKDKLSKGGSIYIKLGRFVEKDNGFIVEICNELSYTIFNGFIETNNPNYITLNKELKDIDKNIPIIIEQGILLKIEPTIIESKYNHLSSSYNLSDLVDKLKLNQLRVENQRKQNFEKKDFFQKWRSIIELRVALLEKGKRKLKYTSYEYVKEKNLINAKINAVEGGNIDIDQIPVNWPITMTIKHESQKPVFQKPIGLVTDVKRVGKVIEVQISLRDFVDESLINHISPQGVIETDLKFEETPTKRETYAINSAQFDYGVVNVNAVKVIARPELATPPTPRELIDFYNKSLNESQQKAVSYALGCEDLYLIQGPPGTGKTSVITELVLQILKQQPRAKILVSSQSNIAVDNVLVNVYKARPDIRMVRVGQGEKVEEDAQQFLLNEVFLDWQKQIQQKATENWQLEEAKYQHLSINMDKKADLQYIKGIVTDRHNIGKHIEDSIRGFNQDYGLNQHEIFAEYGGSAFDLIVQKLSIEDKLKSLIEKYIEGYNIERPEQSISSWLESEDNRLKILLGENNEHYDYFLQLKRLYEEWYEQLERKQYDLLTLYLETVNVMGGTCIGVGSKNLKNAEFDWVIVDEAGRSTPSETLIPIIKGRKIILVGDHKQLPPIVDRDITADMLKAHELDRPDLERSLFEELYLSLPETNKIILQYQYRMHSVIGDMVSKLFYEGSILSDKVNLSDKLHNLASFELPVYWITTSNEKTKDIYHQQVGSSYYNQFEAEVIHALLSIMQQDSYKLGLSKSVGVITAYASQRHILEQHIKPGDKGIWQNLDIVVHTVDAFQGKECDIIIYDLVRSSKDGKLGFTADYRRLNVALSRARQLLVIVGNDKMAYEGKTPNSNMSNPFKPLMEYIQANFTCRRLTSDQILSTKGTTEHGTRF